MRTQRVLHAVDSHTEGMPTRVITGGVGVDPGRHHGRAAHVLPRAHGRPADPAHVRAARALGHVRGHPAAADASGRRLRGAVHRGLRMPADVRARHHRRGHGARRDRHGAGADAGDHGAAGRPGRAGRGRGRRARRRRRHRGDHPQRAVVPGGPGSDRDRAGSRRGRVRPGLRRQLLRHRVAGEVGLAVRAPEPPTLLDAGLSIMDAINAADRPVHPNDATINGCHHVYLAAPGSDARHSRHAMAIHPGLVRPVAVRHRHLGAHGAAAGRAANCPCIRTSSTSRTSDGISSAGSSRRPPWPVVRPWCPPSPGGPGSPARPSSCSTRRTRSRPASSCSRRWGVRGGSADVVVVGAGVVGAACAYYAARAGLQVTVVDRGPVAGGTSGRARGTCSSRTSHQVPSST